MPDCQAWGHPSTTAPINFYYYSYQTNQRLFLFRREKNQLVRVCVCVCVDTGRCGALSGMLGFVIVSGEKFIFVTSWRVQLSLIRMKQQKIKETGTHQIGPVEFLQFPFFFFKLNLFLFFSLEWLQIPFWLSHFDNFGFFIVRMSQVRSITLFFLFSSFPSCSFRVGSPV